MSPLSLKVATRYVLALASPKETLRLFEGYQAKMLPMLREDSQVDQLKALYLEMAEKVRPLAFALDGLVLQRPDESRKFKNLKEWLRLVGRATRPEVFERELDTRDIQIIVSANLETLGDVLKSIVRASTRIQDYTRIEKRITHGPYTLVNNYGFRPEEYVEPLRNLDEASKAVSSAGFGSALYGEVILEAIKNAGYAGRYENTPDLIRLNVTSRYRFGAVFTLVHELGHRVWYKQLSDAQRNAYEDAFVSSAKRVSVADRELFWKALEETDYNPRRARGRLPTGLQEAFSAYWKDRTKITLPPTKENVAKGWSTYRSFVLPSLRYIVLDHKSLSSVTSYGETNVKEDFAEIFAFYCTGKPLTPDAAARFREATGKG